MKRQGFSESNAHGSPCDPFRQSSLIDFQAWQSWQWDGQSVESIRDQRVMLNKWPDKISEWVNTVPNDFRIPVTSEGQEMAHILACDHQGVALLRLFDLRGYMYSVMPVKDACTFIQKCRKQFNGEGSHEA